MLVGVLNLDDVQSIIEWRYTIVVWRIRSVIQYTRQLSFNHYFALMVSVLFSSFVTEALLSTIIGQDIFGKITYSLLIPRKRSYLLHCRWHLMLSSPLLILFMNLNTTRIDVSRTACLKAKYSCSSDIYVTIFLRDVLTYANDYELVLALRWWIWSVAGTCTYVTLTVTKVFYSPSCITFTYLTFFSAVQCSELHLCSLWWDVVHPKIVDRVTRLHFTMRYEVESIFN